jgi:hypothetical protein
MASLRGFLVSSRLPSSVRTMTSASTFFLRSGEVDGHKKVRRRMSVYESARRTAVERLEVKIEQVDSG